MCICLNSVIYASAAESNTDLPETIAEKMMRILASIEPEKENFGLENVDFSSVTIGTAIPEYDVIEGQLAEGSAKIYPVLCDGEMVSQFFAVWNGDDWYVQLDDSLVEKTINSVHDDAFVYIYDNIGVYVYSQGQLSLIGLDEQGNADDTGRDTVSGLPEEEFRTIEYVKIDKAADLDVEEYLKNQKQAEVQDVIDSNVAHKDQISGSYIGLAVLIVVVILLIFQLKRSRGKKGF